MLAAKASWEERDTLNCVVLKNRSFSLSPGSGRLAARFVETSAAACLAAAAKVGILSRVTRVVGPDTLSAAMTRSDASRMGAPMQREPRYTSSLSREYPRCEISVSSFRRFAARVIVCGVKRSSAGKYRPLLHQYRQEAGHDGAGLACAVARPRPILSS